MHLLRRLGKRCPEALLLHLDLFLDGSRAQELRDLAADKARATRRRLLDMAATERMQLAFYHAPFPAIGHVRKDANGFEFVPAPWSPVL